MTTPTTSGTNVADGTDVERDGYRISTDPGQLDLDVTHGFLTSSYWATGISRELVERSIESSIVFGVYAGTAQVGFARVVTDRATFAYLCDVFVLPEHQGRGLGTWLCETVLAHPETQGLRRWVLATLDAHGLYARVGFQPLASPERFMEIIREGIYQRGAGE